MPDPVLEVRDSNGTLIAFNDNWQDAPAPTQYGTRLLQPTNDRESALQLVLHGGSYTAIVTSANGATGTALVEVYNLQ